MDGTPHWPRPMTCTNDLYKRLGTASVPMLIDVYRQFAFKADDRLIIGASYSPPEAFDVAWDTIVAQVERLMDHFGRNLAPSFE